MITRLTAILGMCSFLTVPAAQSQETSPQLDVKGYSEDILSCGNEEHWDMCKQCVTQVWTNSKRQQDRRLQSSRCHTTFARGTGRVLTLQL